MPSNLPCGKGICKNEQFFIESVKNESVILYRTLCENFDLTIVLESILFHI